MIEKWCCDRPILPLTHLFYPPIRWRLRPSLQSSAHTSSAKARWRRYSRIQSAMRAMCICHFQNAMSIVFMQPSSVRAILLTRKDYGYSPFEVTRLVCLPSPWLPPACPPVSLLIEGLYYDLQILPADQADFVARMHFQPTNPFFHARTRADCGKTRIECCRVTVFTKGISYSVFRMLSRNRNDPICFCHVHRYRPIESPPLLPTRNPSAARLGRS